MAASMTTTEGSAIIVRARVQIPSWGRWWADVDLQDPLDADPRELATISLEDITLSGSIVAGGSSHGRASYRVVAGTGGWSDLVTSKAYHDSRGVCVRDVLADVASFVGESIDLPATRRVGAHYARSAGSASRVLHDFSPRAWHVDFAGVTRVGSRENLAYEGVATRVDVHPGQGCVELVPEILGGLVPGVIVDDMAPATDVEYVLSGDRVSVRVYGGPRSSRDLDAFLKVLDAIDPLRAYRCAYEYRVVTQDGDVLNLQPVRASSAMPDLERVPVRMSAGIKAGHLLGSLVTVLFLDGDPSRPCVFSGAAAGSPGWMPLSLELGDAPTLGVARLTDTVLAGPWAGVITSASVRVKAGL